MSDRLALAAALALLVVPTSVGASDAAERLAFSTGTPEATEKPTPKSPDQRTGEEVLDATQLREAIARLGRLHAAHPDAPEPACQLARTYLKAGLAAAARAAAQQAADTSPRSAYVQQTLGWVLEHDLFGRLFTPGADLGGAEKAYRRALALDPDDPTTQSSLAILLEHDADGEHSFRLSPDHLEEVLRLHRALFKKGHDELVVNDVLDLLYARRFSEILAEKADLVGNANARAGYVAARAAVSGAAAAIDEARLLGPDLAGARETIRLAAVELLVLRRYEVAAPLFDEAAKGPRGSTAGDLPSRLRTLRRHEDLSLDDHTAVGAAKLLVTSLADLVETGDARAAARAKALLVPSLAAQKDFIANTRRGLHLGPPFNVRTVDLAPGVLGDLFAASNLSSAPLGDGVQRVRLARADVKTAAAKSLLFVADGEHWRALSFDDDRSPLGAEALRLATAGALDGARRLLDVALEGEAATDGDELRRPPLPILWSKGASGTARSIRIAAAALAAAGAQPSDAIGPLTDCLAKPHVEGAVAACGGALLGIYERLGDRADDGAKLAVRLLRSFPQSRRALDANVMFLRRAHRDAEALALIEPRAAAAPRDTALQLERVALLLRRGETTRAESALATLASSSDDAAPVADAQARARLLRGLADAPTLALAEHATQVSRRRDPAILRTLSSVLAERDRPDEAYHALLDSVALRGSDATPTSEDWYVIGRIAEGYAALGAARDAYAHVSKPEAPDHSDVWNLVDRRLHVIGARP